MKGITAFSIDKNRVTVLFLLIMAVAGFFSYLTYPKQEDPSIQIREALVWAYFPGMAPQRVEDLITRRLEEQIRLLGDVVRPLFARLTLLLVLECSERRRIRIIAPGPFADFFVASHDRAIAVCHRSRHDT